MSGTSASEDTALATRSEESAELTPVATSAALEAEIKAAITVALKFPRNEDKAFQSLMRACQRTSFADEVSYSFPRGGSEVTGPSIYLAREAARVWGNMRHGFYITNDEIGYRTIEAFAWDLETNTKVIAQDSFEKLIYRKKGGWVKPDERDLRELTNRRAAILKRNCILEVLPKDLIEDARELAVKTLQTNAEQDPDGARKRVLLAFNTINVTAQMIEQKLKHPLAQAAPAEIAQLRQIYKSIADGNSTWADYLDKPELIIDPKDAKVSDVLAVAQALGWDSKQVIAFVKERFKKDLTALEKGKECAEVITAIRVAAGPTVPPSPSAAPPDTTGSMFDTEKS